MQSNIAITVSPRKWTCRRAAGERHIFIWARFNDSQRAEWLKLIEALTRTVNNRSSWRSLPVTGHSIHAADWPCRCWPNSPFIVPAMGACWCYDFVGAIAVDVWQSVCRPAANRPAGINSDGLCAYRLIDPAASAFHRVTQEPMAICSGDCRVAKDNLYRC